MKAGHLLPYLQYQLYTKHNGPLFPGMTLGQISEIAGPSNGPLQPSINQKLHLPQHSVQHSVPKHDHPSSSHQNEANTTPSHSQPQSLQRSSAAFLMNPQPSHLASSHLNTDPSHRGPLHTHSMLNPSSTKPPQSPLQTPHRCLSNQRAGQPQPQSNTCQSGCKEVDLKV